MRLLGIEKTRKILYTTKNFPHKHLCSALAGNILLSQECPLRSSRWRSWEHRICAQLLWGGGASWWQINVLWPLMNSFSGAAPSTNAPLQQGSVSTSDSDIWEDYGSTSGFEDIILPEPINDFGSTVGDEEDEPGDCDDYGGDWGECEAGESFQCWMGGDESLETFNCCVNYDDKGNWKTGWVQGECPSDPLEENDPVECGTSDSCELEENQLLTQECKNEDDEVVTEQCCSTYNAYGGFAELQWMEECPERPPLESCEDQQEACDESGTRGRCDSGVGLGENQTCCSVRNHETGETSDQWVFGVDCPEECTPDSAGTECNNDIGETSACYDGSTYTGYEMTCCRVVEGNTVSNQWVEGESCPIPDTPFCEYGTTCGPLGVTNECDEIDDEGRLSPAYQVCCPDNEGETYVWVNGWNCDVPTESGPDDPRTNMSSGVPEYSRGNDSNWLQRLLQTLPWMK